MSTQSNEPSRSESLRKLEALFGGTGEPKLHLNLFEQSRDAAFKVLLDLQNGNPGIHSDPSKIDMGLLIFRASCLKPHHPEQIAERLNILLTK